MALETLEVMKNVEKMKLLRELKRMLESGVV
jgi:hypothetical protein